MADMIYIKTGEFSSRSFNKTLAELKKAQDALFSVMQYGSIANESFFNDGRKQSLFSEKIVDDINSIDAQIASIEKKLRAYASILDSGPQAIVEIDQSFKGSYTSTWQQVVSSFFFGPSLLLESTVGFWSALFHRNGNKTEPKTVIINKSENDIMGDENHSKRIANFSTDEADNTSRIDYGSLQVEQPDHSGPCNMAAIANLLNRKNLIEGVSGHITWKDVLRINGDSEYASWTNKLANGIKLNYGYSMIFDNNSSIHDVDHIKNLCKTHPEGILVYAKGKECHGVVLSLVGDEFWLTDSANGKYTPYCDSFMATENELPTIEDLLSNASLIYYIDGK